MEHQVCRGSSLRPRRGGRGGPFTSSSLKFTVLDLTGRVRGFKGHSVPQAPPQHIVLSLHSFDGQQELHDFKQVEITTEKGKTRSHCNPNTRKTQPSLTTL
ncbi:uncharacterized protein ACO6RY_05577 [Pungitius sinensis]